MRGLLRKSLIRFMCGLLVHSRVSRWLIAVALLAPMPYAWSKVGYVGTVGKQEIHLFAYFYGDGVVRAMYVYDKFDTPIQINGRLTGGVLELKEHDERGAETAMLKFENFDKKREDVTGEWYKKDLSGRLPVVLRKQFVIEDGENLEVPLLELTQSAATQGHYFKTVVVKKKGDFYPRVSAVKVYKKGSDALLQTFDLDVAYRGVDNVSVGDYNFDGIEDFSVFEASYAGPDTTSIYFLRSGGERYIKSDFEGSSLAFDPASKRIYEHSQCCAGASHMTATYKVVHNKMVLLKRKCFKMDQENGDLVTVKCE